MRALSFCCILAGLSSATEIYLHPSQFTSSNLAPEHASLALSRHLGLERFETVGDLDVDELVLGDLNEPFVGKGLRDALLLSLSEEYVNDVLPLTFQSTITLRGLPPVDSMSTMITTYLHRAPHAYTDVFSEHSRIPPLGKPAILTAFMLAEPTKAIETFISEMSLLVEFVEEPSDEGENKFGAFELKGLPAIAQMYGQDSDLYKLAAKSTSALITSALEREKTDLAIIMYTPPASHKPKRQQPPQRSPLPPPVPQEPIGSISRCFNSEEVCVNATGGCSGHGSCVGALKAGQDCFICACTSTKSSSGRTVNWAGDMCERKDISQTFVLLTGTVVTLILLIGGSIGLLFGIGAEELPSTLTGAVAGGMKRD